LTEFNKIHDDDVDASNFNLKKGRCDSIW